MRVDNSIDPRSDTGGSDIPPRGGRWDRDPARFKDAALDAVARTANVAQFVSYAPGFELTQRYCRIRGHRPNSIFSSPDKAVRALMAASGHGQVNVRSFDPGGIGGQEFIYGLADIDEVLGNLRRLAVGGLYTLVNETIDINDGGVSGVSLAGLCEFAPGDTPRGVEKGGVASIPTSLASRLLSCVYGFPVNLGFAPGRRVEFSLHPLREGYRHEHMIIWEVAAMKTKKLAPELGSPNRFSRYIGDKAFGLLLAHTLGFRVPRTLVIRRGPGLAPFQFGRQTRTGEVWFRTCPREPVPGKFTTVRGWPELCSVLAREDPDGSTIPSVLVQDSVDARFAGASASTLAGTLIIEGVKGFGDGFMAGTASPEELPDRVKTDVRAYHQRLERKLGAVSMEWAHDGGRVWLLQVHRRAVAGHGRTIVPGRAKRYHKFEVEQGLEALRDLVDRIQGRSEGVILVGQVGLTSHFGDVLRRARVPSVLRPPERRSEQPPTRINEG